MFLTCKGLILAMIKK